MSESATFATIEFVSIAALRERFGIARSTVHRRLNRSGSPTFVDLSDEQSQLVPRQDAKASLRPRPALGRLTADAPDTPQITRQIAA
jgi:hypothetical protein